MKYPHTLISATLIRRYKRFLADVEFDDGSKITAHTPNTGAMAGCAEPGSKIWVLDTKNPQRKYPYAWELSTSPGGTLVGVNTHLANSLVLEAIENGTIKELQGYRHSQREVRYGVENSRIDLFLHHPGRAHCYVEVKNVTLVRPGGLAVFPDAVSQRGRKHLRELISVVRQGDRAVLVFCIQRNDAQMLTAANDIDPQYARTLAEAMDAGVEVLAYQARVSPMGIELVEPVPVLRPVEV